MFSQNSQEKVIAAGLTAKELVDLLSTNKAKDARKALNYLDGQQEIEVIALLNDPSCGRKDWKRRGIIPRFRNLTKMVVEQSGMIFKDTLPVLEVFDKNANTPNARATQILAQKLADIEFSEFMINFDEVLRLLKTAMIMVQWNQEDKVWMLDILHRGNAEVIIDPSTRKIETLVYRSHENCYWVWTKDTVTELRVEGEGTNLRVTASNPIPNTYKVIPVAVFYDTNTPRTGFWVEQDKSLVNLNEMVNLHITDSEFSNLWSKMSTPVTNMRPAGDGNIENIEYEVAPGEKLPTARTSVSQFLGGPNQVITMDSMGIENPFFEYKSPKIDLRALNEVVDNWIKGYAADWGVSVKAQGEGRAESGFQLIVEEMDNLDLRRQRQRMFESGFKRLYRILRTVYNTATGTQELAEDADLFAQFNAPVLPVDIQVEETVWSMRIKEGRATELDYLMHVRGMNRVEAEEYFLSIVEWNKKKKALGITELPTDTNNDETPPPALDSQMGNRR